MPVGYSISRLKFSDGQEFELNSDDIVIFTGPNNSGKSSALREIWGYLHDNNKRGPVIAEIEGAPLSNKEETTDFVLQKYKMRGDNGNVMLPGSAYSENNIRSWSEKIRQSPLIDLFCIYLNTETRLSLCHQTGRENLATAEPRNALSTLEIDSAIEEKISNAILDSFGFNLILNRSGGTVLELVISRELAKYPQQDYHKRAYHEWITSLPKLVEQGDGVKSFTGILLSLLTKPMPMVLIDEPEAFLHPPQARAIASLISGNVVNGSQIFVATHSDDFVRGFLDAGSERTKIIRLQRQKVSDKEINKATSLDRDAIEELWSDAILRTSDLLSALFHQAAVIVEGETDARFFRVILDALSDAKIHKVPDLRFHYGTGVGSIAKICASLSAVAVPTVVILDQDALAMKAELEAIFMAQGGDFTVIRESYSKLLRFLSSTNVTSTVAEAKAKIDVAFKQLDETKPFSSGAQATVRKALATETYQAKLKASGRSFLVELLRTATETEREEIQSAIDTYDAIISALAEHGILLCSNGEIEGFSPSDGPKQGWLDRVLKRNLVHDSELETAREFAKTLLKAVSAKIEAV